MALNRIKFLLPRIVLSAAVFISLSGVTNGEPRRCYWCGPLAEQVHRSQRAPSCNGPNIQVTVCDEGFTHCAIVATSPPYIESRYCVKFYQDECYPLYCNSTKTWRMTCPCRGDLCNGPNTERENEAFAILPKLVAKTQNIRMKRAVISKQFIGMSTNTKKMNNNIAEEMNDTNPDIDTKINEVPTNEITSEEDRAVKENQVEDTMATLEGVVEASEMTLNNATAPEDTVKTGVPDGENIVTPAAIIETQADNGDSKVLETTVVTQTGDNQDNLSNAQIQIDIPSPQIESSDLKTDIIIMSSVSPKMNDNTKTSDITSMNQKVPQILLTTPGNIKEMIKSTMEAPTHMVNTTKIEGKPADSTTASETLPPAEALQHNETPALKTTEPTSTMANVMNTQHGIHLTTGSTVTTQAQNNTAIKIDAHLVTLFIGIILQY